MNYLLSYRMQALFLTSLISSTTFLQAVLTSVSVIEMPKDNRVIVLHDRHKANDMRDPWQLERVKEILKRTEKRTEIDLLYTLTESGLNNSAAVMLSVLNYLDRAIFYADEKFLYAIIEKIEMRGDRYNRSLYAEYKKGLFLQ